MGENSTNDLAGQACRKAHSERARTLTSHPGQDMIRIRDDSERKKNRSIICSYILLVDKIRVDVSDRHPVNFPTYNLIKHPLVRGECQANS